MNARFSRTLARLSWALFAIAGISFNHMIGTRPDFYFMHFWGKGKAADLTCGFRAALDAQTAVANP